MIPSRLSPKPNLWKTAFALAMSCWLVNPLPGSGQLLNLNNVLGENSHQSRNQGLVSGLINGLGLSGVAGQPARLVDGVLGPVTTPLTTIPGSSASIPAVPPLSNITGNLVDVAETRELRRD